MIEILPQLFVEKVWGTDRLPALFDHEDGQRIGEIWFEPPPQMPQLLVKHIFTSERLSVQTHPDDAQAAARGKGESGKSECWLITSAEPGAKIAVGFNATLDRETMRAAAIDGSIVDLLTWHDVEPGDFFYIPANTVHAIGAGVGLIEIQQNCDITYRLYDYGRPRELHLDEGLAVASGVPFPSDLKYSLSGSENRQLVNGPHFALTVISNAAGVAQGDLSNPVLAIPNRGTCTINGQMLTFGQCAWVDRVDALALDDGGQVLFAGPIA